MTFDRLNLRDIRGDIEEALSTVEKRYGIKLTLSDIRFAPESFRCTLTAEAGKKAGLSAEDRARKEFEEYAGAYFFKTDDFGKFFYEAGKRYTICGIKARSGKYPILARNDNGKVYKFPADRILHALGRHEEAKKASIGRDYRSVQRLFGNRHED